MSVSASKAVPSAVLKQSVSLLRRVLGSPALRTAAALAAGGVGFALGNLLLATLLPEREYGVLALVLSAIQIGAALAVLGIPTMVNRLRLAPTRRLLKYSCASSLPIAAAIGWVCVQLYALDTRVAIALFATITVAALGVVASAYFQSRERFGISLLLTQVHNWVLLASVLVLWLGASASAMTVLTVLLVSYSVALLLGWRLARREQSSVEESWSWRVLRAEVLSAAGFVLALNVLLQLDRLVIARVLSLQDLANYSLVMAIAGSAFRMLQVGAGYALVPRLRATASLASAMHALRREASVVFAMAAFAAAVVTWITPWIFTRFLAGRYELPIGMLTAVIVVGFVRVWQGFAVAVVTARGTRQHLFALSIASWCAVVLATLCAVWVAGYGLVGVVYGLGLGWLALAISATVLAFQALRHSWSPRALDQSRVGQAGTP